MGLLSTIFGAKPPFGTPPFAPPHGHTGGAEIPTTPETLPAKHGLAGFIDRLFNPSNGLGQFGQALVASGGGPLGNAMAYMMQANSTRAHQGDEFAKWKQQYDYELQHPKQTEPHYWESNDGSLHAIGDNGQLIEVYHDPTPKMNYVPDPINGGGQWVAVPGTGSSIPSAPVGKITPIDDPATATAPPAGGVVDRITAQSESGNRDFGANGLLRSPAGAMGRMQVMPGTLARPGFGVRPGNPNDPGDIARVGSDYLHAMQSRYGGDPAKMWGAYNWGPGNLDHALSAFGDNWLSAAPPETQAYVRRNLHALGRL